MASSHPLGHLLEFVCHFPVLGNCSFKLLTRVWRKFDVKGPEYAMHPAASRMFPLRLTWLLRAIWVSITSGDTRRDDKNLVLRQALKLCFPSHLPIVHPKRFRPYAQIFLNIFRIPVQFAKIPTWQQTHLKRWHAKQKMQKTGLKLVTCSVPSPPMSCSALPSLALHSSLWFCRSSRCGSLQHQ